MQSIPQSGTVALDLVLRDVDGRFIDASQVTVSILRPDGSTAISAEPAARQRLGLWRFSYAAPSLAAQGIWSIVWSAQLTSGAYSATDVFEVLEAGSPYRTEVTHLDRFSRGQRVPLDAVFKRAGAPVAATSVSVTLVDSSGSPVAVDVAPTALAPGVYRAWWEAPYNARTGVYVATWSGTVGGVHVGFQEPLEVVAEDVPAVGYSTGVDRISVGSIRAFDAIYRSAEGTLWDPTTVGILIKDPGGSTVISRAPDRLATGVYRETTPLGTAGFWTLDWSGADSTNTVDHMAIVEVVETGVGGPDVEDQHLFGATIEGVRGKLPHFLIDRTSNVTIRQVDGYLDDISAQVSFRIGDYTHTIADQGLVGRVTAMAKYVVELGAAATAQDAGFPANASPNQSEYGTKLWERYNAALVELVQVVNDATPGTDPGAGGDSGGTIGVVSSGPVFRVGMRT